MPLYKYVEPAAPQCQTITSYCQFLISSTPTFILSVYNLNNLQYGGTGRREESLSPVILFSQCFNLTDEIDGVNVNCWDTTKKLNK